MSGVVPDLRVFTTAEMDELTARAGLPPARRARIRAVSAVTGFAVTGYVADELIDWSAGPDDPLWRLLFPAEDMPAGTGTGQAAQARRAGERVLPGAYRISQDTMLVYPPAGPGFGIICPGAAWPASRPLRALAPADVPRLATYLAGHPEISTVELTGTDALSLPAPVLRGYIEPLLTAGHLAAIQLPTQALASWPYRLLAGPDADDTLHLAEQATRHGTTMVLVAAFAHPRELDTAPAAKAAARARAAGALIYTTGPLAGTVNDDPAAWASLWRTQVRMGMVPSAMTVQHITGPARQYQVPLARAQEIFAIAYANVTGLARTVRGPLMHDQHGILCIDGVAHADNQKMFVLHYLQARNPHLAGQPFFAVYDPEATWPDQLRPVPGAPFPHQ
jgi:L-lysine 2,3-aminomutase